MGMQAVCPVSAHAGIRSPEFSAFPPAFDRLCVAKAEENRCCDSHNPHHALIGGAAPCDPVVMDENRSEQQQRQIETDAPEQLQQNQYVVVPLRARRIALVA